MIDKEVEDHVPQIQNKTAITNIVQQEIDDGLTSETISHQNNDAGMNLSSGAIRR